jgi:hypothetical protein
MKEYDRSPSRVKTLQISRSAGGERGGVDLLDVMGVVVV